MSPVQYVGRTNWFKGKRLFDILSRLKNFGVGRIVYRHVVNERYKEPSFFIITKAIPDMSDPTESVRDYYDRKLTRGVAVGIKVFRGENLGSRNIRAGFKADWRLVPKDEEHTYLDRIGETVPHKIIEDKIPFPPLFKRLHLAEMKRLGEEIDEDIMLPLIIKTDIDNRAMLRSEVELLEKSI